MAPEVFISYARSASQDPARALRSGLESAGISVYLDEEEIPAGSLFPQRIADALLAARLMFVFADAIYFERPWCVYEFQVAVAPWRKSAAAPLDHIAVALPKNNVDQVTLHLPPPLAQASWPRAEDTSEIVNLIATRLAGIQDTIGSRLSHVADDEAVRNLRRGGLVPHADGLSRVSGFLRFLPDTLKNRFVGRVEELWRIFHVLETSRAQGAPASCAIQGAGGVGKTQLAAEYVWRYGPRHYKGGVVWINADCDEASLLQQFREVLDALEASKGSLPAGVSENRAEIRFSLAATVQKITATESVLWVVDNLPDSTPGAQARPLAYWCPPYKYVSLLCTSRRAGVAGIERSIPLDELSSAAAIELLTQPEVHRASLADEDWEVIAKWVGRLPLALRILQTSLSDSFINPADLLNKARRLEPASALDQEMEALREEIPPEYLRGVTEAFQVSYSALTASPDAQRAAHLWSRLSSIPIREELVTNLIPNRVLGTIGKRGWIQVAGTEEATGRLWRMHSLVASYLRGQSVDWDGEYTALLDWIGNVYSSPLPWSVVVTLGPHAYVVFEGVVKRLSQHAGRPSEAAARGRAIGLLLATKDLGDQERRGFRYIAGLLLQALGAADELVSRLAELYENADEETARGIAGMLHSMPHTQSAAELCVRLLRDRRIEVRYQALIHATMFERSDILAVPVLDAIMAEENAVVRDNAVVGYENFVQPESAGLRSALSALARYATSENPVHRRTAATIVGRLLEEHEQLVAGGWQTEHVRNILLVLTQNDEDGDVSQTAAGALGRIDDDVSYRTLTAAVEGPGTTPEKLRAIDRLGWYLETIDLPGKPKAEQMMEDGRPKFRLHWPETKRRRPELFEPLVRIVLERREPALVERAVTAIANSGSGKLALINTALDLLNRSQHQRVLDLSNTIIALLPDFTSAYWWRSQALEAVGRPDEALPDYNRVVRDTPEFLDARYYRARLLRNRGEDEAAADDFQFLIRSSPNLPDHFWMRGQAFEALGLVSEALEDYSHAIRDDAKFVEPLHDRGNLFYSQGRFQEALRDFEAMIVASPNDARGYWGRGKAQEEIGKLQDAISDYGRVIELNPTYAEAFYYRSVLFHRTGHDDDAMRDLDTMIQLAPRDPRPRFNRAVLRFNAGDHEGAVADLSARIASMPENPKFIFDRARFLFNMNQHEASLEDLQKYIKLAPEDWQARHLIGTALLKLVRLGEAADAFSEAIALNAGVAEAWYFRAEARDLSGDTAGALSDVEKSLELDPADDRAKSLLNQLRQARGAAGSGGN